MNGNDFYSQTADWVVNTARRKPEALLLVAAGVALMMRSGGGFTSSWSRTGGTHGRASWQDETMTSGARAGVDRATDEANRHASGMRDRVRDTASAYASTVGDYAQDARRRMGEYTGAVPCGWYDLQTSPTTPVHLRVRSSARWPSRNIA